jgi:hypothetical protein
VIGELVAANVTSLTCRVDFTEKSSATLASMSGVEGDSSCVLVLPPRVLPSSSLGIAGLKSGSNMRGSWGGR